MKKIIIGIHGLKNKASRELLSEWWQAAIREGLKNHFEERDFHFELVYWADLNYEKPLDPDITDPDDQLYIENPYVPGNEIEKISEKHELKKKALDTLESGLDKLFLKENTIAGIEEIADLAIRKMFIDLDTYYHGNCRVDLSKNARQAFRERLAEVLKKYKKYKILLIAHSMGTIISYDTLTQVVPKLKIAAFITLGSPLGNSIILKKILEEQKQEINENSKPQTPGNIRKNWYNFADLDDKVAMNYNLADDFSPNKKGINPVDMIVDNNYIYHGQKNPHKVYGYLRTLQVAEVMFKFLDRKRSFWRVMFKRMRER
ncbi:MAG: hypothetical protein Q7J16_11160 [Candidatus Cloacimonadales bacterium]|nr:hypothetical protein [Candidatus Cloacimonadales bacterium]